MSFSTTVAAKALAEESELYEIVFPDHTEYYTSRSRNVTLAANSELNPTIADITYISAPITRDRIKNSQRPAPRQTRLILPVKTDFQTPILYGGLGSIGVNIIRGFGNPTTNPERFSRYWFSGFISELEISGGVLVAKLQTLESVLQQIQVPRPRVATTCIYKLYSTNEGTGMCDLVESQYTYTFTVNEVSDGGRSLICTPDDQLNSKIEFDDTNPAADLSNGHYTLGKIWKFTDADQAYPSMIIGQEFIPGGPNKVKFKFHSPVYNVSASSPDNKIYASWGCDKKYTTCKNKFSNTSNFLGFNLLPNKNPVLIATYNK